MSIAAHVTFYNHSNVDKILPGQGCRSKKECITETVKSLLTIPGMEVFVHTNSSDGLSFLKDSAVVMTHDLSHEYNQSPMRLCTFSRRTMFDNIDRYDHVIYTEDDIAFNIKNFTYYLKYHDIAKRHSRYLDFILVEPCAEDNELHAIEIIKSPTHDSLFRTNLEGVEFLTHSDNKYNPFWVLDRDELSKFIVDFPDVFWMRSGMFYGDSILHMIQENAAMGPKGFLYSVNGCSFVDSDGVLVHHVPDKIVSMAKNSGSRWGRVSINKFMTNTLSL